MKLKDSIKRIHPLNPTQEGMFFTSLVDKASRLYFVQMEANLYGELNVQLLEQSMNHVIKRYDSLRTVFVHENLPQPLQVIMHERTMKIAYEDLSLLTANEQDSYLQSWKMTNKERDFNLAKDLLLRIAVFRIGEAAYRLVCCNHHIILDGWSFSNVFRDLLDCYSMLRAGKALQQTEEIPYNLFLEWLDKQDRTAGISYWKNYLDGYRPHEGLPASNQEMTRSSTTFEGRNVLFNLGKDRMERLQHIGRMHQATINSVFQTVWALVIRSYTRSDDIVFGAIVSGRTAEIEGIDRIVGLCMNTIPVRIRIDSSDTFAECVRKVQLNALSSMKYDFIPFREIHHATDLKHTVIDHYLIFENFPIDRNFMDDRASMNSLGFAIADFHTQEVDHRLTVHVFPEEAQIKFSYNESLHDPWFIEQLQKQLIYTIDQLIAGDTVRTVPVSDIKMITEDNLHKLLHQFFVTADRTEAKTLHDMFGDQAKQTPDLPALLYESDVLTYRELDERSNQMAHVLRAHGVGSEDRVGIRTVRSTELVIAILAVLKAGGAFVPIDPEYPEDRQRFMIDDSGMKVLLASGSLAEIRFAGITIDLNDVAIDAANRLPLPSTSELNHLAYVIYTSGTTGRPKGALIEHRNVVNTVLWRKEEYDFGANDRVLQIYSFAFDAFLSCLFPPLMSGSAVVLVSDQDARDPLMLRSAIREHRVTHIDCVPSLYAALLVCLREEDASTLRVVTLGGEKLPAKLVERSKEAFPRIELTDEYGPTENSIITTIERNLGPERKLMIGKPIANVRVYILNEERKLVPIGVKGQLWIAGYGLFREYLNLPEVTQEALADDPFVPGEKMYQSGDIARWLDDGRLEYVGRLDDQVKVRGYRIELTEIEEVLRNHADIEDTAVLAWEGANEEILLCAYYVPINFLTPEQLREHCSARLPGFMIPTHFISLERLPLSHNGKVDRKALQQPEDIIIERKNAAALNQWEHRLAALCQNLLDNHRIGVTDDFFEAGGTSLKAMMLVSQVSREYQVDLPLQVILGTPTVRSMASYLLNTYRIEPKSIMLMNKKGKKAIFCFSPLGGLGMIYFELGKQLDKMSVYSLDYIDHPHHMEHYIALITDQQPEGDYSLLGYSSGGHLAFEVTKAMEAAGHRVSQLILLDAYRKKEASSPSEALLEEICDQYLASPIFQDYQFAEKDRGRLQRFLTYFYNLENIGTIQADIHLIRSTTSTDGDYDRDYVEWHSATSGKVVIHQGIGGHESMLNVEHVEANSMIIKDILSGSALVV